VTHIEVPPGVPGIGSLFQARPRSAKPMRELAQALLRGPSPLAPVERELIAAFVSRRNECVFCAMSHGGAAAHLEGGSHALVAAVQADPATAPVSPKLKALLAIAAKVARDARSVTASDVEAARAVGAVDADIHDTVLIAAAFCMYNRYVDGLAALTPTDAKLYDEMGARLARDGYNPPRPPPK
jgi:uncharacterized peroxidase-related enzyme